MMIGGNWFKHSGDEYYLTKDFKKIMSDVISQISSHVYVLSKLNILLIIKFRFDKHPGNWISELMKDRKRSFIR